MPDPSLESGPTAALVVLLGGVNVGGHRNFRPAMLARELADLDVVNIGAAGTFVVREPVTQARLRAELARRLPFDAEIMICRGRDILRMMSHGHFADQPVRPDIVRFVSVLSRSPHSAPSPPMSFSASGKWVLKILAREHRFVFGVYRRQMKAIGHLGEINRFSFWRAGHYPQLEYHHRGRRGAGERADPTDREAVTGRARSTRLAARQADAAHGLRPLGRANTTLRHTPHFYAG